MEEAKAFSLRIHEKAELTCTEFDDRLEFKLINEDTGKSVGKPYFKLDKGIDMNEAMKIDAIVYRMHYEIGLDLWESE